MLVAEAMNKNVKTIRSDNTVKEAVKIMNENRIGSLVVVSGSGIVEGIITERDILNDIVAEGKVSDEVKVEEIMTKDIITISPDKTLEEAAAVMTKHKVKKLPVIDNGRLIGIITATDLVAYEKELIEKVAELISGSPFKNIGG